MTTPPVSPQGAPPQPFQPQLAPFPTDDEKTLAMLNYILSIFGWIAPLVIWLVKRESKFVSFHALQMLFWHAIYLVITMVGMIFMFAIMFASMGSQAHAGPPVAFFLLMPLFWGPRSSISSSASSSPS